MLNNKKINITKFSKECPSCDDIMYYSTLITKNKSIKNNVCCKICKQDKLKINELLKSSKYSQEEINSLYSHFNNKFQFNQLLNDLIFQKEIEELKITKKYNNFNLDNVEINKLVDVWENKNLLEITFQEIIIKDCLRNCPDCDEIIVYKKRTNYFDSIKFNRTCEKCRRKKQSIRNSGEGNPFFHKKHSDESRKKIKDSWDNPSEVKQKYIDHVHSNEHKEFLTSISQGEKNGRFGKSLKSIWIKKLGEVEGLKRWEEWKKIQKFNSTGDKNPMYGKPSPNGSGNGWSGWYKGTYFRSIYELSYIVSILERFNIIWECGEMSKHMIKYIDYEGAERNYYADFIIPGKYIIECKPKKLWDSPKVVSKRKFAEEYCK